MKISVVGSEEIKFTAKGKQQATEIIKNLLSRPEVNAVVSGGCHLGGIDIWAAEIGESLGLKVIEHLPKTLSWESGYKPRNLLIARDGDECHCITVKSLPKTYIGMKFDFCYHCGTKTHIKSGGCWTVKQAKKLGKKTFIHVVENE